MSVALFYLFTAVGLCGLAVYLVKTAGAARQAQGAAEKETEHAKEQREAAVREAQKWADRPSSLRSAADRLRALADKRDRGS